MKPIYSYILMFLGIPLFLGLFGVILVTGQLGVLFGAFVGAMRYTSIGGRVALLLLLVGTFFFLVRYFLGKDKG